MFSLFLLALALSFHSMQRSSLPIQVVHTTLERWSRACGYMRVCVTLRSASTSNFYLLYTVHLRNISYKLIAGINPELFTWRLRHMCCGFLFSAWLEEVFKVYGGWMSHRMAFFFSVNLANANIIEDIIQIINIKFMNKRICFNAVLACLLCVRLPHCLNKVQTRTLLSFLTITLVWPTTFNCTQEVFSLQDQ